MRGKILLPLALTLIGALGFYYWFFTSHWHLFEEKCIEFYGPQTSREWIGIIVEKKRDTDNHLAETLFIKKDELNVQVVILSVDRSGLFEAANVGDSIFKLAHDSTVVLKHRDVVSRFELDYKCY